MNADARFCCHCGKPIEPQTGWNFSAGRLTRPQYGRMLGGVCAGIAQQYGWDPVVVRLVTVALFFFGCGSILIAYIAAWIIMPSGPLFHVTPPPPPPTNYTGPGPSSYAGSTPAS